MPTPLTPQQEEHRNLVRNVFKNAGFTFVDSVHDEIVFKNAKTDLDDVFIFDNVIVLAEYTVLKTERISTHLKPKKIYYDIFLDSPSEFIEFLEDRFPSSKTARSTTFTPDQCKIVGIYCSKNNVEAAHKAQVPRLKYLDFPILKYFESLTSSIKKSSRFELFDFLGLSSSDVGESSISTDERLRRFDATVLPEVHTRFKTGYKVISFYISPETILSKCYVLRKHGWKDDSDMYQRMISKSKIKSIRKYLVESERVFINNIIVTLPDSTQILDDKNNPIDTATLMKKTNAKIAIPEGFNQIGLIDGQHRVFAYHEGGEDDAKIGPLRSRQTLLATGIVYPSGVSVEEKIKFESKLFLEINSTQTAAASELKQEIALNLEPFAAQSIGKAILNGLNSNGPLADKFSMRFYEQDKIKTSSIRELRTQAAGQIGWNR